MKVKHTIKATTILMILLTIPCFAISLDQAVQQAEAKQNEGDLNGALEALQQADEADHYNPTFIAYMGYIKGQMAGQTDDMMEAGQLAGESFQLLGQAIGMDSANVKARLFRGTMSMFVPDFMGKLDDGIADLNVVVQTFKAQPGLVEPRDGIQSMTMLVRGYEKKNQTDAANWMRKQIIQVAPGSPAAQQAENYFKENQIDIESVQPPAGLQSSIDVPAVKKQARALMEQNKFSDAVPLLKKVVNAGQADQEVFTMLVQSLGQTSQGYDESIHENTSTRTNMAFDIINILDKAVQTFPDDLNWRLTRGSVSVRMPYFLHHLDTGIEDLNKVIEKTDNDSLKAEALFWLGMAYQKKGYSQWNTIATKLPKQSAFKQVIQQTRPNIHRLNMDKLEKPAVTVEFTLAFQDELAPQTAVWVEDDRGNYIKTLYVSGFSGFVKEKQVVMPRWAKASKFEGVESVTGASIDVGNYTYAWDCKALDGKTVPNGKYNMKVEVSHWPSYKHQLATVPFEIGKKNNSNVVEEGDFLPYVKVVYIKK